MQVLSGQLYPISTLLLDQTQTGIVLRIFDGAVPINLLKSSQSVAQLGIGLNVYCIAGNKNKSPELVSGSFFRKKSRLC